MVFFSLEDSTPLGFDFLVATDSTEKSCDTWLCSDLSLSKACLAERFCLRCDFLELCGVIPSLNFCGVFFLRFSRVCHLERGCLCSNLFGQFTCWKQKTSFVKILCQFSGFVCFMCFMCILCMFYLNFSVIFVFLVFCAFCWGFRFEHENSTCSAQSFNMARWFFRFLVKGFVGLARFRYFKITMHTRLSICKKVNLKMYFANSVLP